MEKTLEPKLEAKPIFPGHLDGTNGCAWPCSIWFVRHHQNLTEWSRDIFEKLPKCATVLTKSSVAWRWPNCPAHCNITKVLLVWTSHILFTIHRLGDAHDTKAWFPIRIRCVFDDFSNFSANWTFCLAWKKLWSQNWKPNRFFLDTPMVPMDAPDLVVFDLCATIKFWPQRNSQSSKNYQNVRLSLPNLRLHGAGQIAPHTVK